MGSVSAQTYSQLEILVIDDCSTDATPDLLRAWAGADGRVRIIRNERNLGVTENMNVCALNARGEWLKFINHDDTLESTCVEELLTASAGSYCRMAACRRKIVYEGEVTLPGKWLMLGELVEGSSFIPPESVARLALHHRGQNFVGEPTGVLLHRSVFSEFGFFNPCLTQVNDLEYWLRVGLTTGIAYVDQPLATFRIHPGSHSSSNFSRNTFRADRLDQIVLLHEYLHNPHFQPLRRLAEAEGTLTGLHRELRARARRLALRAALDARSQDPETRRHYRDWQEITDRYPRLRGRAAPLLPLAAALLRASRVRQ